MKMVDIAREMVLLYPVFELIESAKIKYFYNTKVEPILIYQMGKVGSTTIYETLKHSGIENSIYHIHYLSERRIINAINTYENLDRSLVPMHLRRSRILVKKIDLQNDKIKVIALTREPVGRVVSEFFQNIYYFSTETLSSKNKVDLNLAFEKVNDRILSYDVDDEEAATWFDKEFKEALGIDIYNYSFDKNKGYEIIKDKNVECLIIKMEKLNEVGVAAINDFMPNSNILELVQTNIGSEKKFSEEQKKLKSLLNFDEQTLEYIYSSKYMKHFYTDEEITSFISKWR